MTASLTGTGWRLQGGGIDEQVGTRTHTILRAMHDGTLVRTRQGGTASSSSGLPVRWGHLELDYTGQGGGRLFATQVVTSGSGSGLSPIDTYLLGLAEVPFAWHPQALRTQVVAARSYAEATARVRESYSDERRIQVLDCRCDLRVDTGDQVWAGATKELSEPSYYPNWVQAVSDTAGKYVVRGGQVLTTFYSSSFGGHSRKGFYSGTSSADAPYTAVDVSRWRSPSTTAWVTPGIAGHRGSAVRRWSRPSASTTSTESASSRPTTRATRCPTASRSRASMTASR